MTKMLEIKFDGMIRIFDFKKNWNAKIQGGYLLLSIDDGDHLITCAPGTWDYYRDIEVPDPEETK